VKTQQELFRQMNPINACHNPNPTLPFILQKQAKTAVLAKTQLPNILFIKGRLFGGANVVPHNNK